MIIDFDPNLSTPMTIGQSFKWRDGLFDVCWSEKIAGICCTASGDGAILLWNETKQVMYLPLTILSDSYLSLLYYTASHYIACEVNGCCSALNQLM